MFAKILYLRNIKNFLLANESDNIIYIFTMPCEKQGNLLNFLIMTL